MILLMYSAFSFLSPFFSTHVYVASVCVCVCVCVCFRVCYVYDSVFLLKIYKINRHGS